MTRRTLALPLAAAAAALLAAAPADAPPLPDAAPGGPLQAQARAALDGGDWSAMAWSLDRGDVLFAVGAEEIVVPASNNKVLTSVWALDQYGPDHRFPTDLLLGGPVENGVVRGPVILRGSGDPALGYPDFEPDGDPLRSLRPMARTLREMGVTAVEGGVVGDASVFDTLGFGPSWPNDTGQGAAYYAPTVNGLAFSRNVLWLKLTPEGGRVRVETDVDVPEIPVVNTASPGGGRVHVVRKPGEDTIRIRGSVSGGRLHRYGVGVSDPTLLATAALRQVLREEGIEVRGPLREGRTPDGATLVHRHLSVPLGAMIHLMNRDSDNFFAEHVWKLAAAKSIGQGSYTRAPPASALFFHRAADVPFGHVWQADGSGLSSQNHVSALAVTRVLAYADRAEWSETFHESLAVGGDREGTLRRLFRDAPARGNLHAKTGYIRGVRTLSGYVTARNGERIAFSLLYNGRGTSRARGQQEEVGNLLANFSR